MGLTTRRPSERHHSPASRPETSTRGAPLPSTVASGRPFGQARSEHRPVGSRRTLSSARRHDMPQGPPSRHRCGSAAGASPSRLGRPEADQLDGASPTGRRCPETPRRSGEARAKPPSALLFSSVRLRPSDASHGPSQTRALHLRLAAWLRLQVRGRNHANGRQREFKRTKQ